MLRINPFYLILTLYLVVNLIYAFIGFRDNQVEIEFSYFNIDSMSFFYSFLIQLLVCIFILLLFSFFNKRVKRTREIVLSRKYAIFLLVFQIAFLSYNLIYGVNIAGVEAKSSNFIINILFVLIPADLLFILFSPYIKSNKWFYLNLILFVISNTLRGWMGGILLAIFVAMCRKEVIRISLKSFAWILLSIIVLILFLPYLNQMKWVIRSDGSVVDAIQAVNDIGYLRLVEESLFYVFNRFQHNYHVALLLENHNSLSIKYNDGYIMPFWMEGIVQTIFSSIFNLDVMPTLGNQMARDLFYSEETWSSNPGLSGWFIVLQEKFIFLVLYALLLLFSAFYAAYKYFDKKMLLILAVFSIVYLFHGWIASYVSMVTYLMIIIIIRRIKL